MSVLKYIGNIFIKVGIGGTLISFLLYILKFNLFKKSNAFGAFVKMIATMTLILLLFGLISIIVYIIII